MFKNILVPVSSEFYSKKVLECSVFLAEKFNSSVNLFYIIEEKTLDQADKFSDGQRTNHGKTETKRDIINKNKRIANSIVFDDAEFLFKNKKIPLEEKIVKGEFSSIVKYETDQKQYDLIVMGFDKECILKYHLFDDVHVPIWVEENNKNKSILAVCSNLAPNQRVPEISVKLSKILGWSLKMLYVVDTQDTVEVDKMGRRSGKKSEKTLIDRGKQFVSDMQKKGINIHLVKGSLEKETIKAAREIGSNLVIIGREQKKKRLLGVPTKSVKRKMAEKCEYSILFIN